MRAAPKGINLRARAVETGPNPVPAAPDRAVILRLNPTAALTRAVEAGPNPVQGMPDKAVEAGINSAVGTNDYT